MAKKAYIGVDGKARAVKKMYIGVDGVARKIKKAYIGIGGVARPCFTGGELAYWGKATDLRTAATLAASASTKNEYSEYAFFGGGYVVTVGTYLSTVNAYDKSLTRLSPEDISPARYNHAATAVGYYALFGGGETSDGYYSAKMNAIDDYLEFVSCDDLAVARKYPAATTVGDEYDRYNGIAIFAGGYGTAMSTGALNTVDVYGAYLTHSTAAKNLTAARRNLAATTVGNYALFGGGVSSSYKNDVDAYDVSATRYSVDGLTIARQDLAATTVGNYALFGGGYNNTETNVLDVFDTSLTRVGTSTLSVSRKVIGAVSVGAYAIFAGGYGSNKYLDTVDVFDESLTRTNGTSLSVGRSGCGAATVGDYALFAGGTYDKANGKGAVSANVDVYTVQ
jgi:hypothetical protein